MKQPTTDNLDQVNLIDSYAVNLIKQIYEALRDMGEMRRKNWNEKYTPFSNIYEESIFITLGSFLKQYSELRGDQMLELLSETHRILKTGEPEIQNRKEEIYSVLEKMVLLGGNRKGTDTIFDQITSVSAAMVNGDFSKRVDFLEDERLSDDNLLTYIANAFNMLNEDLAEVLVLKKDVLKKSVMQSAIHLTGEAMVLFVTDIEGNITYTSGHAAILYGKTFERMDSLIVNYENVLNKIITEGGLNDYPIHLKILSKKGPRALLNVSIAYSSENNLDGIVYSFAPFPTSF